MPSVKHDELVVLLGAGASKHAGLKDSNDMITAVETAVTTDKHWMCFHDLYHFVKSAIRFGDEMQPSQASGHSYNIERLVNALEELARRNQHPLYPFVGAWHHRLIEVAGPGFERVSEFRDAIVERVLQHWVVPANYDASSYLEGLVTLKREYAHPLRVFTLNYDLCVENACKAALGGYPERGFDDRQWFWRQLAEGEENDLFLYKLHGSIDWTYNAEGFLTCVDEPRKIASNDAAVIFGTSYKLQYIDPFLFLAYEFRRRTLESKVILSVGYGFGDEHINGIVRQALRGNDERVLLSVHPCRSSENDEAKKIGEQLSIGDSSSSQIQVINNTAEDFLCDPDILSKVLSRIPERSAPFHEY